MIIYIFNEYKQIFFKVKKEIYNRFLSLFHGLRLSIGVKDPPRNSRLKQKIKKGLDYYIFFFSTN